MSKASKKPDLPVIGVAIVLVGAFVTTLYFAHKSNETPAVSTQDSISVDSIPLDSLKADTFPND